MGLSSAENHWPAYGSSHYSSYISSKYLLLELQGVRYNDFSIFTKIMPSFVLLFELKINKQFDN